MIHVSLSEFSGSLSDWIDAVRMIKAVKVKLELFLKIEKGKSIKYFP